MGLFSGSNAPRRELKRTDLAKRGVIALVVAAVVLGLTFARTSGAFSNAPEVTTTLRNVGGSLAKGSDVKMKGALVGKVTRIEGSQGKVDVVLTLDEDALKNIPSNVTARVLPATVFGTSFVDLNPPAEPAGSLKRDAKIAEDVTKPTIELQQALDDIDELVKALGPAELASAIGSAAQALNGRGAQLGVLFERTNTLLAKVNPKWPLFAQDLALLADNLEIVSRYAPDLLQAVDDGLVAANTIVTQQAQLTALLAGGTNLVNLGDQFLNANKVRFVESIRLAAIVTDAVYDNRRLGLHESFLANTRFANRATPALKPGFIPTTVFVKTTSPAYYSTCPGYEGRGCS